jgi:hypothetical protein
MQRTSYNLQEIAPGQAVLNDSTHFEQSLAKIKGDGWLSVYPSPPRPQLVEDAQKNSQGLVAYVGKTKGKYAYQIRLFLIKPNGSYQWFGSFGVENLEDPQAVSAGILRLIQEFGRAKTPHDISEDHDVPLADKNARSRLAALTILAYTQQDLLHKLDAVKALMERGGTEGERASAKVQYGKILHRLQTEFGWETPLDPNQLKDVDLPKFNQRKPSPPSGVNLPGFMQRKRPA